MIWKSYLTLLMSMALGMAQPPAEPAPRWKPIDSVRWAAADIVKLPEERRVYTRYFDFGDLPLKERPTKITVLTGHLQGLNRTTYPQPPELVPDTDGALVRIDLRWYGWDKNTFGALADQSTTHHVRVLNADKDGYRKVVRRLGEKFDDSIYHPALAQGDGGRAIDVLARETRSRAAIVSGTWFIWQTSVQEARGKAGYYDFLQVRDEKTFQELIRFNAKTAAELDHYRVTAFSGVVQGPRRQEIDVTTFGRYCHTKDSIDAVGKKNPLDNQDETLEYDATEQFCPNGVDWPVWFLGNRKGERQDKAPDNVVGGERRTLKDLRLQVHLDCIHCHFAGKNDGYLDMTEEVPIEVSALDFQKHRDLVRRYKQDDRFQGAVADMRRQYAKAVKRDTDWTTSKYREELLKTFAYWDEAKVDAEWVGRQFGFSPEEVRDRLRAYNEASKRQYGVSQMPSSLTLIMNGKALGQRQWQDVTYDAWVALSAGGK